MVSVATYVARLPAPALDVTAWTESIEQPELSAKLVRHDGNMPDKSEQDQ